MADFPRTGTAENPIHHRKSTRKLVRQPLAIWPQAPAGMEELRHQCSDLDAQIEELARSDGFRRQFATNMLRGILDSAIEGTRADMGNIQLYDPKSGRLLIHVQKGFRRPFLDFFDSVHSGEAACGSALQAGKRVVVPDVKDAPVFRTADSLRVLLNAGVRSVQSTPIVSKSGAILGMLSTHYRAVKTFGDRDLQLIDHWAGKAAAIIEWQQHTALRHEDASRG